ncbi:TPA: hypothetical protein ACU8BJ_002288 [Neisseria subflava]
MSIFNLIVYALSAAVCLCLTFKIAVFAYIAYGERVSWWWGNDDDRVKVSWFDFAVGAIWLFLSGVYCLLCFAEELLK